MNVKVRLRQTGSALPTSSLKVAKMRIAFVTLCTLHALPQRASAMPDTVVFVAPSNLGMPLVKHSNERLDGGVLKQLGDALAIQLGKKAKYIVLPSKRIHGALGEGDADMLCYAQPSWISADLHWTKPVFLNSTIVVGRISPDRLQSLRDLQGIEVGTVSGYYYPEFVEAMGHGFVRSDAPDMRANLNKLIYGRIDVAITDQATWKYVSNSIPTPGLQALLTVGVFYTSCGISRHSKLSATDVDIALDKLKQLGLVPTLLTPEELHWATQPPAPKPAAH